MNFKKILIGTSLFLATSTYSIAQNKDTGKQVCDTIWEYAYPVLEHPVIVLDREGNITSFRCSGLVYSNNTSKQSNGWSDCQEVRFFSNEKLWQAARDDLKKRLGITDEKTIDLLVIETVAYHNIVKREKQKSRTAGLDWRKMPWSEQRYIEKFNEMLKSKGYRLNRNGRIYDYVAYQSRQK